MLTCIVTCLTLVYFGALIAVTSMSTADNPRIGQLRALKINILIITSFMRKVLITFSKIWKYYKPHFSSPHSGRDFFAFIHKVQQRNIIDYLNPPPCWRICWELMLINVLCSSTHLKGHSTGSYNEVFGVNQSSSP